jgi:hypothetical protein
MEHKINDNKSEAETCSINETRQYYDNVTANNTSLETQQFSNE